MTSELSLKNSYMCTTHNSTPFHIHFVKCIKANISYNRISCRSGTQTVVVLLSNGAFHSLSAVPALRTATLAQSLHSPTHRPLDHKSHRFNIIIYIKNVFLVRRVCTCSLLYFI